MLINKVFKTEVKLLANAIEMIDDEEDLIDQLDTISSKTMIRNILEDYFKIRKCSENIEPKF